MNRKGGTQNNEKEQINRDAITVKMQRCLTSFKSKIAGVFSAIILARINAIRPPAIAPPIKYSIPLSSEDTELSK